MTKEEAIKYLQQLYTNSGHCWLDEQRIEAIGMAIKALQEEPVNIWHDASEEPMPNMELICVGQYGNPLVLSSNSDSFKSRYISKWAYFNDLLNLSNVKRTVKDQKEEPVSEDLEEAGKEWLRPQLDKSYANYGEGKMMELTHFDGYAMLDAIEYGAKWQKEQMMSKAFKFTKEHNTACILASECLRNHGWFNRERDFNDLFRHLSCVDELFKEKFRGKTKVIVIKEINYE